jgi:hypothetical protein
MIRLARAQPGIAVLSFDLRCATPVPPVATGRNVSSPPRSLPKQAFNATRQQTASTEIPIASDARSLHTSRGFLPWRFAYAGPSARRATFMGPASANLHTSGRSETAASERSKVKTVLRLWSSARYRRAEGEMAEELSCLRRHRRPGKIAEVRRPRLCKGQAFQFGDRFINDRITDSRRVEAGRPASIASVTGSICREEHL